MQLHTFFSQEIGRNFCCSDSNTAVSLKEKLALRAAAGTSFSDRNSETVRSAGFLSSDLLVPSQDPFLNLPMASELTSWQKDTLFVYIEFFTIVHTIIVNVPLLHI